MSRASVIVSFYNKIDYLKLVLAGFEIQTEKDFEIIIADDGSNQSVVNRIQNIFQNYSFRIKHIWQEDKGFRKNKILNKSILAAESDYLIFIDGDCIPHSYFVEGHLVNSEKNKILTGRRVNLSEKISNQLTEEKIKQKYLEKNFSVLLFDGLFGKSYDVEKGIFTKNKFFLRLLNSKPRGILGCNFSLFKDDILEINGFDERYEAPSIGEDSDVQFRLELIGKKIKSINHIAIQYHLHHKLQERPQKNLVLLEEIKRNKIYYTPFGLKK
ncbi:MAG: glycosyltransferase [Ignavibacterium sp.]|nr:glycosyltransferase [Ignavibacterium sp.]MDW8374101.1 glycosyltransferase [Ignavibacteriales bacterium]